MTPTPGPRILLAYALALAIGISVPAGGRAAPTFESHWQDGRAELAGYRYHVVRYGQARTGQAVAITVTEPFRESSRVKADRPSDRPGDVFEALKLNLVRDFQTGIYDYNTMTSVFVRSRDFSLAKVVFSSMEWCGSVYEEVIPARAGWRQSLRSYFEGESADRTIAPPANAVAEDQLYILLRGLRGDWLRPGESRAISLLPGAIGRRLGHRPLAWVAATAERAPRSERVTVPAGTFATDRYRVTTRDARRGTFWIERAYPHRIVRWSWESTAARDLRASEASESAELTGSARLPYWELHGNGQESYLKALGLSPLPSQPIRP